MTRGRFHKPIYALPQAFMLCAQLLRSYLQAQKFGAERKSLVQSVNGFMKSTPVMRGIPKIINYFWYPFIKVRLVFNFLILRCWKLSIWSSDPNPQVIMLTLKLSWRFDIKSNGQLLIPIAANIMVNWAIVNWTRIFFSKIVESLKKRGKEEFGLTNHFDYYKHRYLMLILGIYVCSSQNFC